MSQYTEELARKIPAPGAALGDTYVTRNSSVEETFVWDGVVWKLVASVELSPQIPSCALYEFDRTEGVWRKISGPEQAPSIVRPA